MMGVDVASEHVDVATVGAEPPDALSRVAHAADGHSVRADSLLSLVWPCP